jgi:exosortase K
MSQAHTKSAQLVSLSLWERARVRAYEAARSFEIISSRLRKSQSRLLSSRGEVVGRLDPHPRPFSQGEKGELRWQKIAQFLVIGLSAWSLKSFYSTATVDQLRWILWPTTKLVELVTGAQFAFESRAGYMNREHTFLIAASCAGVNFLITAFVTLGLRKLWKDRNEKTAWRFIPIAAVLALVATIVTNTVRISLALEMLGTQRANRWLNAEEVHRLEGILVYFGFLLLLFVVAEEADRRLRGDRDERAGTLGFSRFLFPLAVYYVTTLAVPLLNGAFRQSEFWEHSAFVLLTPLVLIALALLIPVLASLAGRMPATRRQEVGAPTTALR